MLRRHPRAEPEQIPVPARAQPTDMRFRKLIGPSAWARLPAAIRARFGKRLDAGQSVAYQGVVTAMQMNPAGWVMAQAARLVGAPFPFDRKCLHQPAVVVVTEDRTSEGQFWIRQYGRARGFPQVVHSSKRFAGPTGLEEYIGYGIGMALQVVATDDALYFESDHFFVQIMGRRLRLPRALGPGNVRVGHHDLGDGCFRFSLTVTHPILGRMLCQDAVFRDAS
ncbi:protein of unknown function [Yoonia tamlensis]|uniref:DUF4166 domain-containing protein n=1 Tax=Yoonia tamlensis TaxID=390270 RepID=A0A1I6FTM5_9RHOB|nr:DUF4166 domain-containing protein [Yoonia tamlensis]SFR33258.1 protein of unknown function [Yoonia tamlensis]